MDRILKFSLFFIIFINFVYAKEDTKIIGGYKIEISQAPFQVSIIRTTSLGRSHKCGGSIITSRHILTAAHCTFNGPPLFGNLIPPSQFSVR
jgi:secreted trypsin-like serine protease